MTDIFKGVNPLVKLKALVGLCYTVVIGAFLCLILNGFGVCEFTERIQVDLLYLIGGSMGILLNRKDNNVKEINS